MSSLDFLRSPSLNNIPKRKLTDWLATIESSEEDLVKHKSINFISCICIGWADLTYETAKEGKPWVATYRDLTNEGSRLYYAIKKLHNNKEVRILTFNHI